MGARSAPHRSCHRLHRPTVAARTFAHDDLRDVCVCHLDVNTLLSMRLVCKAFKASTDRPLAPHIAKRAAVWTSPPCVARRDALEWAFVRSRWCVTSPWAALALPDGVGAIVRCFVENDGAHGTLRDTMRELDLFRHDLQHMHCVRDFVRTEGLTEANQDCVIRRWLSHPRSERVRHETLDRVRFWGADLVPHVDDQWREVHGTESAWTSCATVRVTSG